MCEALGSILCFAKPKKQTNKKRKPSSLGNSVSTSVKETFGSGSELSRKQKTHYLVHMEGHSKPLEGGH